MAGDAERVGEILALVRRRGGRITTARRAIVAALVGAGHHVTAEELADVVQAAHPDVHRSTVYRTLDVLSGLGVVVHAHLGHGPAVYHLVDEAHYHLVCQACGRVRELPASVLAPVAGRLTRDYQFVLDPTHFALGGQCVACAGERAADAG